jgi:hypothetical protein
MIGLMLGIAVTAGLLLVFSSQAIANQLFGPAVPDVVGWKPQAHSLGYNNASLLGVPLTLFASSSTGETLGPQLDSNGHYVPSYESGRVMLSLYGGRFPNGTSVWVVTATNMGTTDVMIWGLDIFGNNPAFPLVGSVQSEIIGCAHGHTELAINSTGYPDGTTVNQTVTYTVNCGNPALLDPLTLSPGKSFSGYIVGSFTAGTVPLNFFSAGAGYTLSGSKQGYQIQVQQPQS